MVKNTCKLCANLHVTVFEYGYMRSNSARLTGYLTHRDVTDMSNLVYCHFGFIWSKGATHLPSKISPFEAKWVEQKLIQTLQPGETKTIQMPMYQFKLTKS